MELVCNLLGVKRLDHVIPFRLTRGAFAVYQQLSKDKKLDSAQIKRALTTTFDTDKFMAYEQFKVLILHPGDIVDIYLAYLQKLSVLF